MGDFGKESSCGQVGIGDQLFGAAHPRRPMPAPCQLECGVVGPIAGDQPGDELGAIRLALVAAQLDGDPAFVGGAVHDDASPAPRSGRDSVDAAARNSDTVEATTSDMDRSTTAPAERPGPSAQAAMTTAPTTDDSGSASTVPNRAGDPSAAGAESGEPAVGLNVVGVHAISGQRAI